MQQEFDAARNVYLDVALDGSVLTLRHLDAPFASPATTPQLVAADYLGSFADLLQITPAELSNLGSSPSSAPEPAAVELRYGGEKSQFDSTTVAYEQTALGLPVFGAGLAVQMRTSPYRVMSSQSTRHSDVHVEPPLAESVKRAEGITAAQLAESLGLPTGTTSKVNGARKSVVIEGRQLVVYRYEPDQVQRDPAPVAIGIAGPHGSTGLGGSLPRLPLTPVPDAIRPGQHYVCVKVDFALTLPGWGELHWTAILDVATLAPLYLRPFVDDVTGLVFDVDPITTNGGPAASGTSAQLNPVRVAETLQGLAAPVGGTQSLVGDTVSLVDSELPTIAAPTEPGGTNFDFDARTDSFSAVNAYVHSDRFFRLTDSMGLTRSVFYPGTTFPTSVDQRGLGSLPTDPQGLDINAHCLGNAGGNGIGRTTFALADLGDTTNPIGIADDFRVVLHELAGHGVLYNHVKSANFGFSHSAGDSVAVILNDPGSKATDRFVSFPWVNIGRRHDRTPAAGWGWAGAIALGPFGPLDGGGYNNEQILSTTMFRLYRSLGGDSTDSTLNTQRFAARMTIYLIMRAIATLTPSTNPSTAAGFEAALETADAGDWVSENLTGGAYRKVIRWAFEKQGMFQPTGAATPNNNVGAPPAVDVYVDDGRGGEYPYQPVFWENQNIWNRLAADGGAAHQDPVTNRTNYAYVKIRNRGSQAATSVIVKAFHANPAAGLSYPNDWIPMTTAQLNAANVPANNGGDIIVGPFAWVPTNVGHECIFMIVSSDGDDSNVGHIAAGDSIPEWRLVPNDNNIGQRNVAPVPGGTTGLTDEFKDLTFTLKNPMLAKAAMTVEHTLPALMAQRGWDLRFANAGGAMFSLEPGESREIVMQLTVGEDFTAADVEATADRTILVSGKANGVLIGGMSYVLDPTLTRPNRPGTHHNPAPGEPGHHHDDDCGCEHDPRTDQLAQLLVRSLERHQHAVRGVEIKKLVLEVDLDDCDCP